MNKLAKIVYTEPKQTEVIGMDLGWSCDVFAEYNTRNINVDQDIENHRVPIGTLTHEKKECLIEIAKDFCSLSSLKSNY